MGSHGPPASAGAPGPRRLNAEVKRSQKLIAIFPSEDLLIKLVGTYLIEENDRWAAKSKQYLPAGGRGAMRGRRRCSQR
nr:transposase [Atopobium sp. oral taxon 416]